MKKGNKMYIEKQYIINENDEFFIVYERDNHYNGSVIAIIKVPETPGQQRQLKRYLENYGYVDRVYFADLVEKGNDFIDDISMLNERVGDSYD